MKSYTDIEQSMKLAKFLPLESADMSYIKHSSSDNPIWRFDNDMPPMILGNIPINEMTVETLPCWSLTALLDLCPTINRKQPILTRGKLTSLWYCYYEDEIDTQTYDNPIDACYEMITRLNELNLL